MSPRNSHNAANSQDYQRQLLIAILEEMLGGDGDEVVDVLLPRLTWHHLQAGEVLFDQGDTGDELFLVVSGRLRAVVRGPDGERVPVGEIMRGQSIGEMAMMTGRPRRAGIVAMRDSVLVRFSRDAYEELVRRFPRLAITLTRVIVDRLRHTFRPQARVTRPVNICLMAITDDVDVVKLAHAVARKLSHGNRVLVIARDAQEAESLSPEHYRQLTRWLDDVEARHEFLLFVAEAGPSEWTQRCLRAADEIVLFARADLPAKSDPSVELVATRRLLVLLHGQDERTPGGTRGWLDRHAVGAHLHIRPELDRDIARLARVLSGTDIGLVLSGGGARGFAHLGALKALEEFGAQIDSIGGASIGAIMGAYCAFDMSVVDVIAQARQAFARGPTSDVNLIPMQSLIGGQRLKTVIDDAVRAAVGGDIDIEDTWKSLFCVVTNYTSATEVTIRRGNLAKWLRTSVSIPGVLPLVAHDGELLGDGGTFNNFPTDVMLDQGTGFVIGSDLLQKGFDQVEHDELPSNRQLLLDRLLRRKARRFRVPGLMSVLVNSMMLASQARQRDARLCTDICFTPAMEGIGMLDWRKFDRIVELGYHHASDILEGLPSDQAARLRGGGVPARGVLLRAE